MEESPNIAILILAAGASTRMGSPKQLLPWGESTLLEHTINQAEQSEIDNIYIVLGANHEKISTKIKISNSTIIISDRWQLGLGSSLSSGIKYLQGSNNNYDGVLVMLADQPEVDAKYLNSMIKKLTARTGQIIATAYDSQIGVPAIFDQKYFAALSVLEGDKGAKKIIGENLVDVTTLSPKTSFIDIDTKKTYEQHHKKFFSN